MARFLDFCFFSWWWFWCCSFLLLACMCFTHDFFFPIWYFTVDTHLINVRAKKKKKTKTEITIALMSLSLSVFLMGELFLFVILKKNKIYIKKTNRLTILSVSDLHLLSRCSRPRKKKTNKKKQNRKKLCGSPLLVDN